MADRPGRTSLERLLEIPLDVGVEVNAFRLADQLQPFVTRNLCREERVGPRKRSQGPAAVPGLLRRRPARLQGAAEMLLGVQEGFGLLLAHREGF